MGSLGKGGWKPELKRGRSSRHFDEQVVGWREWDG